MRHSAHPPWLPAPRASHATRILVVDDVRMVRDRMGALLVQHGWQALPAESGEHALAIAQALAATNERIALAIVDVLMPHATIEGIEAARRLTHEHRIMCLMLTTVQEAAVRMAASLAGALGYLTKDVATGDAAIIATIHAALSGMPLPDPLEGLTIDPSEALAIHQRQQIIKHAMTRLTPQERRVCDYMAQGLTNNEIAARLVVSVSTINTHVQNVLAKLGLSSRRDLQPQVLYDSLVHPEG